MGSVSAILSPAQTADKPKLLDQRVKLRSCAKSDIELMHYVYVLQSVRDDGFYIGYSSNLGTRLRQHSEGDLLATSYRGPWKLIHYEAYLEQADALGRETYLKTVLGEDF